MTVDLGGFALDRVVVVQGEGQGSGVLLDPYTVLTARHVVGDRDAVEVIHPSSGVPVSCRVRRSDPGPDAVLLAADSMVIGGDRAARLGPIRYGRVATDAPLPHCQIVGFPEIQRYGDHGEDLEYDQYGVSVLPMAGRLRDLLVCQLDQPAAAERGRGNSPLAGLSGAPVFAGGALLGVVTQVPRDRHHLRVEAVPVETLVPDRHFEDVTDVHPQDELFEARYAADLSARYRSTEIFGIEELGRRESRWDLDTAYLSLEAGGGESAPQRIDALLADRPRTLLRGEAGAGKTTLVRWLAAHAANGTLGPKLRRLNRLVPFVVALRDVQARGGRFPAVSELLSAGRVVTDDAPEGWSRRVLEAGRGLLLVDGLDEIPERDREEARRWLTALLDRYPRTRCLATVRPSAVARDWLAEEGFAELTLLPMNDQDIVTFIGAWHDAARLECDQLHEAGRAAEERELLGTLEASLLPRLVESPALYRLVRTPLLCAVVCALHRRRRGLLPTTRWSLFRAALAMLLGGRDAERGVGRSDVLLDSDEQHALLQPLALRLLRTGQEQLTHDQAIEQLALTMRDMPRIRARAEPERVLRFLLDRSGLLAEPSDGAVQFIHRTFQDYLAAKELHESGRLSEALKHAHEAAWTDVIVMGVGHATRKEAHHVVRRLVRIGDTARHPVVRRWHHLLAALCADSLLSLDAELMEKVRARVAALLPFKDAAETLDFARLGDWVVDLLPGPEGLDDRQAEYVVKALTEIRSASARRALRGFASHPAAAVRLELVAGWYRHPAEEYARDVLSGVRLDSVTVPSRAHLTALARLGSVRGLVLTGDLEPADLEAHLPAGVRGLWIRQNRKVEDLGLLRRLPDLEKVSLSECPALRDISALADTGVSSLGIGPGMSPEIWDMISGLPRLPEVGLHDGALHDVLPHAPTPNIRHLHVYIAPDRLDLDVLCRTFPDLRYLSLDLVDPMDAGTALDLSPLRHHPGLPVLVSGRLHDGMRIVGAEELGDRFIVMREQVQGSPSEPPEAR
ncbi:NACHT domain-containing protein [Streptomyces sp. NPDC101165]|uniref:NACHT domain-containing protein n=1 Tax=Streptomyces sp. NPDC101165 TaxID=3366119 RepID=UPI0037F1CBE7